MEKTFCPVAATFRGAVNLSELDPPNGYTLTGQGQGGAAGFARMSARVSLKDEGLETLLNYAAQAEIGGKLASVGSRLLQTVAKMNEYARTGVDTEFHKGETAIDTYYSDPGVKPNTCLGPIIKPPFYAVPMYPGEIGTKGGLNTDERARVLREDGSVIAGLYAVGNTSAAVMGPTYAGAGSTLGPAMTFAYIAARDIAAQVQVPDEVKAAA